MRKASDKLNRHVPVYKSYNFRDKDPIIHEIERLIDDTGISYAEIERRSGVTRMCLKNWFTGRTKKPMHCTIRAVLRAMGYDWKITETTTERAYRTTSPVPGYPRRKTWSREDIRH